MVSIIIPEHIKHHRSPDMHKPPDSAFVLDSALTRCKESLVSNIELVFAGQI